MILSGAPYLTAEQKENFKKTVQPIVFEKDGKHLLNLWQTASRKR